MRFKIFYQNMKLNKPQFFRWLAEEEEVQLLAPLCIIAKPHLGTMVPLFIHGTKQGLPNIKWSVYNGKYYLLTCTVWKIFSCRRSQQSLVIWNMLTTIYWLVQCNDSYDMNCLIYICGMKNGFINEKYLIMHYKGKIKWLIVIQI